MQKQDPMKETRWFLTALLLLFIALKLTDQIQWSWWWVLAPAWGPPTLALALLAVAGIVRFFETPEQKSIRKVKESLGNLSDALRRKS
jgi:hypothetical protein